MSEDTRSLAHVERIASVHPIPDADAIEYVKLEGMLWTVVVRKDLNYRPGDLVVFFEIDSILPDHPAFVEMLKGKPWSQHAARLKTIKLRGQLSQGYVRRLSDLGIEESPSGTDVTEALGVIKYEPPTKGSQGTNTGHWLVQRSFVPKTDEPRIQNTDGLKRHARLQGQPYVITVKLDGQSGTFGFDDDGVFWACSRNFRLVRSDDSAYWQVAYRYDLENALGSLGNRQYVVQGEVCGPSIQGNRLGLSSPDLYVFNVWDKDTQQYLDYHGLVAFCHDLGVKPVPVHEVGTEFCYTPEELLTMAEGKYPSGQEREGIVIRHQYERGLDRISYKAISNKFLLKGGD